MPGVPSSSPLIRSLNPYDTESHRGGKKHCWKGEREKQKVMENEEEKEKGIRKTASERVRGRHGKKNH